MNAELFGIVKGTNPISRKRLIIADDTFVDRLNRFFTPVGICVLCIAAASKQFIVGKPLQCWIPQEFTESWEQYAEGYCLVKNTYFVPMNSALEDQDWKKQRELSYYQWVPFFLVFQALCFYFPFIIWRFLNSKSGVNIKTLVSLASKEDMTTLAYHIECSIIRVRKWKLGIFNTITGCFSRFFYCGNYLPLVYLVTKCLYIGNIIGQFFLTSEFLKTDFFSLGRRASDIVNEDSWKDTGFFPRVTMCDFDIRALGSTKKFTIECVLTLNLFYEKVFILLWYWFLIIGLLTAVDLILWIFYLFNGQKITISNYTRGLSPINKTDDDNFNCPNGHRESDLEEKKLIDQASEKKREVKEDENQTIQVDLQEVYKSLGNDGTFVMEIIASNVGYSAYSALMNQLFTNYQARKSKCQ